MPDSTGDGLTHLVTPYAQHTLLQYAFGVETHRTMPLADVRVRIVAVAMTISAKVFTTHKSGNVFHAIIVTAH